jgi:hypothetical protein
MARRREAPRLTVEVSFETTRTSPQSLADAYESAVPITRRDLGTAEPRKDGAATKPLNRRAEDA